MRISTNNKLIRRRAKYGTYAALGGVVVLAGGMVASFWPQVIWISLIAIIIGFILAQLGNYNLLRFGRTPRPDQVIENALKGFDDRYHYYAWALPAPYVLLTPHGIYSFVTRHHTGQISVNGARWHTKLTLGRVLAFFGQEGLGNPTAEAFETANRLTHWIKSRLPDVAAAVQPAVVFIDERAQLQVTEPTVPVLEAKGVKKWLRGAGKGENLKNADYKALEELFDAAYTVGTSK
jgi:hypothetical protein